MNIGAQKRINAILQNVQSGVSPEFIEKGKTAQVGEIREWTGQKMQKTVNGWIPVKEGTGSKGEHRFEDKGGGKFELEIPGKGGAQIAEGNGQFEVKVWNKDFKYLTDDSKRHVFDSKSAAESFARELLNKQISGTSSKEDPLANPVKEKMGSNEKSLVQKISSELKEGTFDENSKLVSLMDNVDGDAQNKEIKKELDKKGLEMTQNGRTITIKKRATSPEEKKRRKIEADIAEKKKWITRWDERSKNGADEEARSSAKEHAQKLRNEVAELEQKLSR